MRQKLFKTLKIHKNGKNYLKKTWLERTHKVVVYFLAEKKRRKKRKLKMSFLDRVRRHEIQLNYAK